MIIKSFDYLRWFHFVRLIGQIETVQTFEMLWKWLHYNSICMYRYSVHVCNILLTLLWMCAYMGASFVCTLSCRYPKLALGGVVNLFSDNRFLLSPGCLVIWSQNSGSSFNRCVDCAYSNALTVHTANSVWPGVLLFQTRPMYWNEGNK